MNLPALFLLAFTTTFSGAVMPGPVLFATVRWSAERGRWAGPLIVVGHAVVEIPLMMAIVFGLAEVLKKDTFAGAVGLAGGTALLVMGVLMLRAAPMLKLPTTGKRGDSGGRPGKLKIIGAGALTSVSNPYFAIWWATVGLSLVAAATRLGAVGYPVFYAGHILSDLVWYGAVSEAVHHGRRLLSDRSYRWLVRVCAVLLIGLACLFAYMGTKSLAAAWSGA